MKLVTAQQMQTIDRQTIESFGIPGRVLMENAGRGAFDTFLDHFRNREFRSVCILAGRGNNGGDGFVVGRYLMERGITTTMVLLSSTDKVRGDAKANLTLAEKACRKTPCGSVTEIPDQKSFNRRKAELGSHDIFIDAILGTGLKSEVKGFFKSVIQWLNERKQPVFSIDIPSGLNADTGQVCGAAVKADATATFAFAKAGHILFPGNEHTGDLTVIDIGIPGFISDQEPLHLELLEESGIAGFFPDRPFTAHKGNFGHLMVIAGSKGKTGAAVLCSNAAARSGAGLVTLAVPQDNYPLPGTLFPEIMTTVVRGNREGAFDVKDLDNLLEEARTKTALAVGPGLGTRSATRKLVEELVLNSPVPMVMDADALNGIALDPKILAGARSPLILTPHPGEMARLTGSDTAAVQKDRMTVGQDFARYHGVTLVLKGAQTLICLPDGQTAISPSGNPGMASGGMGDVLTGMIGGFLAQELPPAAAAKAGVFIHGRCADHLSVQTGGFGFLASDIISIIPKTIHGLT